MLWTAARSSLIAAGRSRAAPGPRWPELVVRTFPGYPPQPRQRRRRSAAPDGACCAIMNQQRGAHIRELPGELGRCQAGVERHQDRAEPGRRMHQRHKRQAIAHQQRDAVADRDAKAREATAGCSPRGRDRRRSSSPRRRSAASACGARLCAAGEPVGHGDASIAAGTICRCHPSPVYGRRRKRRKFGLRFSTKAFLPSCASSVM